MICNLCKLLSNPLKRHMLARIYSAPDGFNVGLLADEMSQKGLVLSGVSQYLKQLESLGIIRRSRAGRYVNYFPDASRAAEDVRRVVEAFIADGSKRDAGTLDAIFAALANPFRAQVIGALAQAHVISGVAICEKLEHQIRYLKRDLQAALDANLLWADDTEAALASYHFIPPSDPFIALLVSLC